MPAKESSRIESLEVLVDELLKDSPEENLVRQKMEQIGLEYQTDPVIRLNDVLQALRVPAPKFKDL